MKDDLNSVFGFEAEVVPNNSQSRGKARFFGPVLIGFAYCLTYAVASTWIAFVEPALRDRNAILEIQFLSPFGEVAYSLSQLAGAFAAVITNSGEMGNLAASIPLFITGFIVGALHVYIVWTIVMVVRHFMKTRSEVSK